MTEPKPPARRTRTRPAPDRSGDDNPYLDAPAADAARPAKGRPRAARKTADTAPPVVESTSSAEAASKPRRPRRTKADGAESAPPAAAAPAPRAEAPRTDARSEPRPEARAERRPEPRPEPRSEGRSEPRFETLPPRPERPRPLDASPFDGPDRNPERREPNQYDRAFDRTDGPERQDRPEGRGEGRPEGRGDRPFQNQERRDRGGRRRGRNRHRDRQDGRPDTRPDTRPERPERPAPYEGGFAQQDRGDEQGGFRRGRRGRNRFRRGGGGGGSPNAPGGPPPGGADVAFDRAPQGAVAVEGTLSGWFDPSRDGGFLRRAMNSYLPDPTDPFVPPALVRLHQLRRGDKIDVTYGRDPRGRSVVVEVTALNDGSPVVLEKRLDFNTLVASYPDRKLTLETGRPAKSGPELTRRAIDLIAPIGYGQRALIVAPARAGKTTLLQAIVEGVAVNHPQAVLLVLLVDERPEEVSEMVTWGYGEVVASSFDMPPKRHTEVAEMTLERARRLVEMGKDVVIVLDSITRMARAHNTVDRGTGRTMSGGLDATAMQKPKAFFGSARMISKEHGGGSLTIIATALVETGSRMDDIIFEEFKGTGNCEIKLDRSLADRRIFPAFDIAVSGTRREEKLFRPDQLEKVHLLRRGLAQLPPQAGMEWLIKRIAATSNNDSLLDGL
ncbi:MAG: transcription termination factor Rho [Gemmatimonadetes bacterium]|nr:transcription termination factor Rho [Gemmatimonadota bacterium]